MELYRNGRSQKTTFIHFEHFSINRQNIFNVLKLQQHCSSKNRRCQLESEPNKKMEE
jgi:hypothetical protein